LANDYFCGGFAGGWGGLAGGWGDCWGGFAAGGGWGGLAACGGAPATGRQASMTQVVNSQ
jgi:hypothetical protein